MPTTGTFVWFELLTQDEEASKAFYPEVLPWRVEPMEMPGFEYQLLKAGEAGVGGIVKAPSPQMPTAWVSYVQVDDVDATAQKVKAAGGQLPMDAMDIPTVGRIQPVIDPQGGMLSLFTPEGEMPPLEGPGTFHWNELWTKDPDAALAFYRDVLGYTVETMPMPQGDYHVLKSGDVPCGGVMKAPSAEIPQVWVQYVTVEDVDAAVERATQKGGKAQGPAMEVEGVGRFAIFSDPQGGMIGVIEPAAR